MIRWLSCLAALSLFSGCALPLQPTDGKSPPSAHYRCDDGSDFSIAFMGKGARLTRNGETLVLTDRRPASGMWYASETHEFHGKGEAATWREGHRAPLTCRVSHD